MADRRKSKAMLEVEKVEAAFVKMMAVFAERLGRGCSPRQARDDAIDWLHDEANTGLPQRGLICLGDRLDGVRLWVEREGDRYCVVMLTDDELKAQITLSLQGRQNAHKRALRIDCQAALNGNGFCRRVVSERIRRIAKG